MTVAGFLLKAFSNVPHLNFKFKLSREDFTLDWRSEYIQSLAFFAAAGAVISVLLLLTIIIIWICQTCRAHETTGKTRRKVRRLSTALFAMCVASFFMLGISLFANEHINRGASISINSVINVKRLYKLSFAQVMKLQDVAQNASTHLKALEELVHAESKKPDVNQTLVQQVDSLLTNISDEVDAIGRNGKLYENRHGDDVDRLEYIRSNASKLESERWAFLVIALSITMCVLFAGIISFCRQSKKGAVVFSAIGFFIFLIVWALISFTVPIAVGLSDLCTKGDRFSREQLGNLYESVQFYNSCHASPSHDNVPDHVAKHVALVNQIPVNKAALDRLMEITFNSSALVIIAVIEKYHFNGYYEVNNASSIVGNDVTTMLKVAGAVESSSACYVFNDDVQNFYYGLCDQSIVGFGLFLLSLVLLGKLLFVLLIVVSKTWKLFSRLNGESYPIRVRPFRYESGVDCVLPSSSTKSTRLTYESSLSKRVSFRPQDYHEVDEDDVFNPMRNMDSNIPIDIYGTHMFNPRTRERTEPSTNTTTGTGEEQSSLLWNHNAVPAVPASSSTSRHPFADNPYSNYGDRYEM